MIPLDGKALAQIKFKKLASNIEEFFKKYKRKPKLVVLIVGNDPASHVYVQNKKKACLQVGMESEVIHLPDTTSKEDLKSLIEKYNSDSSVDGFLVQMPLPESLKGFDPSEFITPLKDVDGLGAINMGLLVKDQAYHKPCTPEGVIELLKHYQIKIAGASAVVVGRSQTVGWPLAYLLTKENATVSVVHSKTPKIQDWTKNADLVVVAAGRPGLLKGTDFKKNAVVVDVGIHRSELGLVGDVDVRTDSIEHLKALSPVPGGVGPMTVAQLIEHTYTAALSFEQEK
jgi:methylenetetrahydrofolate dehydrogenase (NADP+) / methenyltetrahydrofolate cyclohydrolase